jgi:predicted MPP superfamily phosphohydrolase
MGRSPETHLMDLFSLLFSTEELRGWASRTFGREITDMLSGSRGRLPFELVVVLSDRGLIDDRLFDRLIEERPGRREEIITVARIVALHRSRGVRELDLLDEEPPASYGMECLDDDTTPMSAHRLLIVSAPADKVLSDSLAAHLGPLVRQGRVSSTSMELVGTRRDETAGAEFLQLLAEYESVSIVVVLLSADILGALDAAKGTLDTLLRVATARGAAVLPVVVRPCLWTDTPFARYPVLPHSGRTIATAANPDEAWLEVVESITAILEEFSLSDSTAVGGFTGEDGGEARPEIAAKAADAADGLGMDVIASAPPAEPPPPVRVVLAADVFRTTRMPTHTLVETPQLEDLRFEMTVPGRLLVVEGPSGIGKTVAVKHALEWVTTNGHGHWQSTYLNVKDESDVARIDALLQQPTAELRGYTIIDDFHDLDPERKRRLGRHAKALADRDGQEAKLIFVGIPRVHESLARDVPDLGSRMTTTRIRRVEVAHIRELIEKGEQALNVSFAHRARLAVGAQGSFIIAQRLCETAVRKAHVWETVRVRTRLDHDVPELLPTVRESLQAELYPRVQAFAMQDDGAEARGAALALLWHLREADDGSMQLSYIRPRYPELHDAFELLLRKIAEPSGDAGWRSLFYCDPAGGQIAIEDPKLHFYLKHLAWEQLGRDCGVELRVLPDNGQLGFLSPRQRTNATIARNVLQTQTRAAQRPAAPGPVMRVLHLSDFHFRASTTWDANTVLGRLAVDIGRLVYEGLAPDLIVLTGDIAYSGKVAEYDLARTWITKELLPAAGVGVDRLVIVPGNHDADRSRVDFVARQVGKGIRDERNQQRVTEVLDGEGGALLLRRLEAFMSLVNDLGAAGAPLVRPWYQAIFELEGMTLHCAAMASSWLSADDSDYGGLLLGLRQCNEVLGGADQADVVLVALHHPWDYVAEWDRRSSLAEIERSAGLILRGHLHEERHDYRESVRHGGVLELAAGACYETSEHPNSYHLIELWPRAPRERRARVHVRYWDPARRDWRPDLNAFGAPWGELPLRVRT